jgi:hypothetical protein
VKEITLPIYDVSPLLDHRFDGPPPPPLIERPPSSSIYPEYPAKPESLEFSRNPTESISPPLPLEHPKTLILQASTSESPKTSKTSSVDPERSSGYRSDITPVVLGDISDLKSIEPSPTNVIPPTHSISHPPHILTDKAPELLEGGWRRVQALCPDSFKWDVEYNSGISKTQTGAWTLTPVELEPSQDFPLTIAGAPVVIPVEYRWPPMSGINPPPDPRPSSPIDPAAELSIDTIRDILCTFKGCVGFYLLLNGILQLLVEKDFDSEWVCSHLPHRYGGLRVSYIPKSMIPTTAPAPHSDTQTSFAEGSRRSKLSIPFRRKAPGTPVQNVGLNDYIEARTTSMGVKDKFTGRIGLRVCKNDSSFLVMSTHVITEAIISKPRRLSFIGLGRGQLDLARLSAPWGPQVEIRSGNQKIGTIEKTYDPTAGHYPDGFDHDITLVKPTNPTTISSVVSPKQGLGWMSREGWNILKRSTANVRFLGSAENHRNARTFSAGMPSEIRIIGAGILLNQKKTVHPSRHHDEQTWNTMISRSVLYRVHPNFDPPTGYSGVALYADRGQREDGSEGPAIIGFQSFVQMSGNVQNFHMEGPAFQYRLQEGRIAFYGAFQIPDEIKREYTIL